VRNTLLLCFSFAEIGPYYQSAWLKNPVSLSQIEKRKKPNQNKKPTQQQKSTQQIAIADVQIRQKLLQLINCCILLNSHSLSGLR